MNSYEEKKQARIDYYKEKSVEAARRGGELLGESSRMMSAIPLGQPIHVGHHSEAEDRNYRNSAGNMMQRSVEEADKAGYYADKAKAAENNNAISSDDPDAMEKLQVKVKALQSQQTEMKKANSYYRKHGTMRGYQSLSDNEADQIDQRIKGSYSWQQQPYPAYLLQNNNANIHRINDRIKSLEKRDTLTNEDGWEFDGGQVVVNVEHNRVQIIFDDKPSEDIRTELKVNGFKWAPSQGAWQRQLNGNGLHAVKQLKCARPKEVSQSQTE